MFSIWQHSLIPVPFRLGVLKGTMSSLASYGAVRRQAANVQIGTKMYILGGYAGKAFVSETVCYDTATNTWSTAPASLPRCDHSAVAYNGLIYLFGGEASSPSYNNDLRSYNPSTGAMVTLTSTNAPSVRLGHRATVIGTKMYVFGGINGSNAYNDLRAYDFTTSTWSAITPTGGAPAGRRAHGQCEANGKLYVFGGINGANSIVYTDLWEYDPAQNKWTQMPSSVVGGGTVPGRWLFNMVSSNGMLHAIGGTGVTSGNSPLTTVYSYDLDSKTWQGFPAQSTSLVKIGASTEMIGNSAYSYGGYTNTSGYVEFNTLVQTV